MFGDLERKGRARTESCVVKVIHKVLLKLDTYYYICMNCCKYNIRHINPLMFDVTDDKPEGVAQGVYHQP